MLVLLFQRYTGACSRLLVQYKAAFKQVEGGEYPTVESFMKKNKVSLPVVSKIKIEFLQWEMIMRITIIMSDVFFIPIVNQILNASILVGLSSCLRKDQGRSSNNNKG